MLVIIALKELNSEAEFMMIPKENVLLYPLQLHRALQSEWFCFSVLRSASTCRLCRLTALKAELLFHDPLHEQISVTFPSYI